MYRPILPNEVASILNRYLFSYSVDDIQCFFNRAADGEPLYFNTNDLLQIKSLLKTKSGKIKNIGFDFPLFFENKNKPLLAIVAMDPKRNDSNSVAEIESGISVSTMFSIGNQLTDDFNANDYRKFIKPLVENFAIYLTDIYKIYYDTTNIKTQKVSNKDSDYTGFSIENNNGNIHRLILKEELQYFFGHTKQEEKMVIALGKEAKQAITQMFQLNIHQQITCKQHLNDVGEVQFIFMPHISRTVTQSIPTIANLYMAMGILKNYSDKLSGDAYINAGQTIKDLQNTLFS